MSIQKIKDFFHDVWFDASHDPIVRQNAIIITVGVVALFFGGWFKAIGFGAIGWGVGALVKYYRETNES